MRHHAAAALAALALALLLSVATAQSGPCIECKDCKTNHCWQNCKDSCSGAPVNPDKIIVSGDACKYAGRLSGPKAATSACETTRIFCNGGMQEESPEKDIGDVTLTQCANIALGACQQAANDAKAPYHPCGHELLHGLNQCTAQQFRQFFEGETRDVCFDASRSITGVVPGTNKIAYGP